MHLEVRDFTRKGAYENVNFTVRKGEILGLAGLVELAARRSPAASSGWTPWTPEKS